MTRPRVVFFLLSALAIAVLIGMFFYHPFSKPELLQVFPATVMGDCAPWDGAAFTISVQYDPGRTIIISIWKSPDISYRVTYTFPDKSGKVGNAYLAPELSSYASLEGKVTLQRVSVDTPIEGEFRLKSERGELFEGMFKAGWEDTMILCG